MQPLYIFRHVDCEGPAYFAEFLDERGIPYRLIAIDQGEAVPATPAGASGLVFMGGPMSVNDDLPWLHAELALIHQATQAGLPLLGHCLGGQLISKALGARVGPQPVREIGWHEVERTDSAAARDWLGELPARFEAYHWHGETFEPPPGAQLLLRSAACAHQAYVLGDNILALQCHVEMTAPLVREWAQRYAHELDDPAPSVQDTTQMTTNLTARIDTLHRVARTLYTRWIQTLQPHG